MKCDKIDDEGKGRKLTDIGQRGCSTRTVPLPSDDGPGWASQRVRAFIRRGPERWPHTETWPVQRYLRWLAAFLS